MKWHLVESNSLPNFCHEVRNRWSESDIDCARHDAIGAAKFPAARYHSLNCYSICKTSYNRHELMMKLIEAFALEREHCVLQARLVLHVHV